MAINRIQNIREGVARHFDDKALLSDTEEVYFSPDRAYFFKSNYFRQTDENRNWTVSKIEIFGASANEKIFEFIRNDDTLFHGWLINDGKTYLLLSEDLQGKSIFDLESREFYSYSFEDDEFIWCEYSPSPDGKYLAVIGCYWACPYEIRVFDTSVPTSYPYEELYRQDTFQEKIEWLDNDAFKIIGNNDEYKIVSMRNA
jgi:hypothetical protein